MSYSPLKGSRPRICHYWDDDISREVVVCCIGWLPSLTKECLTLVHHTGGCKVHRTEQ